MGSVCKCLYVYPSAHAHMYVCVCVCVCALCIRERASVCVSIQACVCGCMYMRGCVLHVLVSVHMHAVKSMFLLCALSQCLFFLFFLCSLPSALQMSNYIPTLRIR